MNDPLPDSWGEARNHVLPVVRRITQPAHAWMAEAADPRNALVRRDFVPFLHELVVLDRPDDRVLINRGMLVDWQVGADEVFAAAHHNLARWATEGLIQRPEYGGLWQAASDDRYESSRLLLAGFLGAFDASVTGRPVAVVPASRVLLVGGDGDSGQIETLVDLASRAFEASARPLSPVLYTVEAQRVVPWEPSASVSEAVALDVSTSQAWLAAHEYARQGDQLRDNPHIESEVAPVELVEDGQRARTSTRWDPGLGSVLLPVTDRVLLVASGEEHAVSWSAVWTHARGCLGPTRLAPTRYRARAPMPSTLARILAEGS